MMQIRKYLEEWQPAVIAFISYYSRGSRPKFYQQAIGGQPPRYAPPLSAPEGTEAPSAAEQTAA